MAIVFLSGPQEHGDNTRQCNSFSWYES
jgi:hypothetical protein